jgi:hypothetical protein
VVVIISLVTRNPETDPRRSRADLTQRCLRLRVAARKSLYISQCEQQFTYRPRNAHHALYLVQALALDCGSDQLSLSGVDEGGVRVQYAAARPPGQHYSDYREFGLRDPLFIGRAAGLAGCSPTAGGFSRTIHNPVTSSLR